MRRFRLSPEATQDISDIWAYIARDNIDAARRVRLALLAACRRLAQNPGIGHQREDLTDKPVRFSRSIPISSSTTPEPSRLRLCASCTGRKTCRVCWGNSRLERGYRVIIILPAPHVRLAGSVHALRLGPLATCRVQFAP
jgi:plasmid stabilization system protein ParE